MEKITKKQFLADVMHEINSIKKNATSLEKERLDFKSFTPTHEERCIYGQLAGDCTSKRAMELMNKSCTRVFNATGDSITGVNLIYGETFTNVLPFINGNYTGRTWKQTSGKKRDYQYLSALEGYINLKGAKIKSILQYIKGERNTLKL